MVKTPETAAAARTRIIATAGRELSRALAALATLERENRQLLEALAANVSELSRRGLALETQTERATRSKRYFEFFAKSGARLLTDPSRSGHATHLVVSAWAIQYPDQADDPLAWHATPADAVDAAINSHRGATYGY